MDMKEVIICKCGCKEYYGMSVMRDGITYCRKCIYEIWQKETNYTGWKPGKEDYTFPYYEDGKDYTK